MCGEVVDVGGKEVQPIVQQQKIKRYKPFYKKIWFWIVIVLVFIAFTVFWGGNSDSTESTSKGLNTEKQKNAEVESLEFSAGFDKWKESGFPGRVRTDIIVTLPVSPKEGNTYAVQIGTLYEPLIVIMQEDENDVRDWEWLTNAQPFDKDTEKAYFKVTLSYVGQHPEKDLPVFIVSDIESY